MRKIYPYLKENYYSIESQAVQQRNFLSQIDNFINQKQYVKITLLDWQGRPIREIAGEITSGSITKDGSSAVRRTLNLSCTMDSTSYNIDDLKSSFAINKKIYVEVGIKNYTKKYMDPTDPKNYFPILWFPQGVFFIGQLSVSASTTGLNLTITGKDKMCKLNGDVGGKFPATVVLNKMDIIDINGNADTTDVKIYDIIQECVNHYGEEDLENIIIDDVPLQIKQVMSWNSSTPIYGYYQTDTNTHQAESYILTYGIDDPAISSYQTYQRGDNIGYIYTDFVWVGEDLVAAPGETITSILDKIKSFLGNYEYYYDVYGIFHFQEIKNYLNTTLAKTVTDILEDTRYINNILGQLTEKDYVIETSAQKSVYNFTDGKNLTQLTVNPQYENIRNDFIVLGETDGNIKSSVRYHLAIDNKPDTSITYNTPMICYKRSDGLKALNIPVAVNQSKVGADVTLSVYSDLNTYKKFLDKQKQDAINQINELRKQEVNNAFQIYLDRVKSDTLTSNPIYTFQEDLHYQIVSENGKNIIKFKNGENYTDNCLYITDSPSWYEEYLNHIEECEKIKEQAQLLSITQNQITERHQFDSHSMLLFESDQELKEKASKLEDDLSKEILHFSENHPPQEDKDYKKAQLEIAIANIAKNSIANNSNINNNYSLIHKIDTNTNVEQELKQKQFEECIRVFIQNQILQKTGNTGIIYYYKDPFSDDFDKNIYFYWNNNHKQYELIDYIAEYPDGYQTTNWQTHLYIMGLINRNLAKDSSQYQNIKKSIINSSFNVSSTLGKLVNADYYFEELNAFWPLVFDFEANDYYGSSIHKANNNNILNNLKNKKEILESNLDIAKDIKEEADAQSIAFYTYFSKVKAELEKVNSTIKDNLASIRTSQSDYRNYTYYKLIADPAVLHSPTKWFLDIYDFAKNLHTNFFMGKTPAPEGSTDFNFFEKTDYFMKNNLVNSGEINIPETFTHKIYWKLLPAVYNIITKLPKLLFDWIKDCPYILGIDTSNPEATLNEVIDNQQSWFENQKESFNSIHTEAQTIFEVLMHTNAGEKIFAEQYYVTKQKLDPTAIPLTWFSTLDKIIEILGTMKSLLNPTFNEVKTVLENNDDNDDDNNQRAIVLENAKIFNPLIESNQYYYGEEDISLFNVEDIYSRWPAIKENLVDAQITIDPRDPENETYQQWLQRWFSIAQEPKNYWLTRRDYWVDMVQTLTAAIAQCAQSIVQENLKQTSNLYEGEYYLDFIDPRESKIGEFCVNNIGRRQLVEKNTNINCLFALPIPDIIFINVNAEDASEQKNQASSNGLIWSQVSQEIYQNFAIGGWRNPAWEAITNNLYLHTTYQKTVSITALPAFYLEPNSRITINDRSTNTYGDYLITSITLPLGAGQLMTASGSEILQQR